MKFSEVFRDGVVELRANAEDAGVTSLSDP